MSLLSNINTPCIGICSTVYGDEVCRGCKRQNHEIIAWNTYDEIQKQVVFNRLAGAIIKVMQHKVVVTDAAQLREQLESHAIRYREEQDPLCWAFHLLRVGANKIHDLPQYGLAIQPGYQHYSLAELFTLIDEELLSLS